MGGRGTPTLHWRKEKNFQSDPDCATRKTTHHIARVFECLLCTTTAAAEEEVVARSPCCVWPNKVRRQWTHVFAIVLFCACVLPTSGGFHYTVETHMCWSRENGMIFFVTVTITVLNYQLLASVELRIKLDRNECQRLNAYVKQIMWATKEKSGFQTKTFRRAGPALFPPFLICLQYRQSDEPWFQLILVDDCFREIAKNTTLLFRRNIGVASSVFMLLTLT